VTLPPGRAKLSTKPEPTGSMTCTNTIGIVRVAFSTICGEGSPPSAAITATCRFTRSALLAQAFGHTGHTPSGIRLRRFGLDEAGFLETAMECRHKVRNVLG
jgi:hypothetical protein